MTTQPAPATAPPTSRPPRILTALAQWARRTPDAVAVQAPDGSLTFAELAGRVGSFAAQLQRAGAAAGDAIGLSLGRSRDSVPALLAVWWLGATAVPLDERHPADRLSFVLRDAGARLIVGDALPDGAIPPRARRLVVEPDGSGPDPVPPATPEPDGCAYLIYTSGTTGWPKGVEVSYRGLDTFVAALDQLDLGPGGLGINAVSPAFDGWLWCTLLYLVHGQGMALLDLTGAGLTEQLSALRPRTVCLTPSLLALCDDDLPGTEVVVVAGEPAPPALIDRFAAGRRMLNVYGPTEATIAATWADSARGDDPHTIGRPLPGYAVRVLDGAGQPVADGEPGELYVAGPAVALGYRNRPELTKERFLDDPYEPGGRMYRTGDLVRTRPDGQLEYLGRLDDQVKVRGYRIELSEVERVVTRLPQVRTAAAYPMPSGDLLGIAVVPAPGLDPAAVTEAVRGYCAEQLPEPMRPGFVDVVATLPLAHTGKVDREELARRATVVASPGRAPGTDREREVCEVWGEVLQRPVADVDADFFEIGGHSLLAARAVSLLRRRTGLPVSMRDLLANTTAASFAAVLDRKAAQADRPAGAR